MRWRHGLSVVIGLLLLVAAIGCQRGDEGDEFVKRSSDTLEVEVVSVERTQIGSSLELVGTLFPWKYATIATEVTGVITEIPDSQEKIEYELGGIEYSKVLPLDIGHPVKKGAVLVKIDSTENELALKSSQARLMVAEKELINLNAWKRPEEVAQLDAQVREAQAIVAEVKAEYARLKELHPQGAVSTSRLEESVRAVEAAEATKNRTDAALELANAGPTEEQIAVAKAQLELARAEVAVKADALRKCEILCPLETAWIVERYAGVGDHVTANPSTPIMRVVDSSILLAQVGVPERYQGRIKPNDEAWVRAEGVDAPDSVDGYVRGKVVLVNAQVDPETRTFRARIGINNNHQLFKAGTFVKVRLSIAEVTDLVVPADSLSFANGEPAVFVLQDGKVEKRPVILGISDRKRYQVLSGVAENERVVKGELSLLVSGLTVRPKVAAAD